MRKGIYQIQRWLEDALVSPNPAAALLEVLVHTEIRIDDVPATFRYPEIEAPDSLAIEDVDVSALGQSWWTDSEATRRIGDRWLQSSRTALFRVPSVIVPATWNVLINPRHPESGQVRVIRTHSHDLDARWLRWEPGIRGGSTGGAGASSLVEWPFREFQEVPRVAALKALLRLFSFLFHALLTLFLIALSGLALAFGGVAVRLGMLPWTGSTLLYVLFFGSLFGLATLVLAILGKLRVLFFVWSLAVAVLLVKGYIFSGYHFAPHEITKVLCLIAGSWLAVAGAWFQMWQTARKVRY